jgi:peptide/nickel transport system ATP-binding protein
MMVGTSDSAPILEIHDLSVSFRSGASDIVAVHNVSIDVPRGQTIAVVGESGSGKTTMAAAINRLLPDNGRITGGEVRFDGQDLAKLGEGQMRALRGAHIGLVPQDPMSNLNPLMRVGDQIAEALEVHGLVTGSSAKPQVVELLDMVGIPDAARRVKQYPHEFSGGMRQRVLIAIGLACRPRLLIADEPTSALDVTVQRRILDRLGELTAEMGTSVFLITHDLGLAAERADAIAVMLRGEIVEAGQAASILADPEHDYTKQLLQAAPSLSSRTMAATIERAIDTATAAPLVTLSNVVKSFKVRGAGRREGSDFVAVDSVSFDIPRGATVSIVGESGSGKSTTANLLLGLETATSGAIVFDGADVGAMDRTALFAFRRRVQPVFQNPYASLDPRYTVQRSIAEPMKVHKLGTAATRRQKVAELLDQVALSDTLADRLPHELSGGQRQRVAIARALALAPELVVLDEPVSALDVLVQAQILVLLARLQHELGLSYLFISHDLAVVRMISHTVHVMHHGRIVETGTPTEIFEHPQSEYTRELLDAIPGATVAPT